jgi:hypothetical protein
MLRWRTHIFTVTDACRALALILEGHAEVADGVA